MRKYIRKRKNTAIAKLQTKILTPINVMIIVYIAKLISKPCRIFLQYDNPIILDKILFLVP